MNTVRRRMASLLLGAVLMGWTLACAASNAWEPVRQGNSREDISTWVRSEDGMAVKAFRGVTEVNQSTLNALALLADIPNLSNWIFKCASATVPSGYSADHTYARFNGVWPASPRDVLFKTVVTQQADGVIVVDSRQVAGYPPADDHVRMPFLHNVFRLTPLKGGWTRVEFETQIDLGGLVPTWLANLVSTQAAEVTLSGMQREIGKARYKVRSVDDLPAYYFHGKTLTLPPDH
ncbi:MAG: START domain-containing protein [Aquabacterium sp.]